MDDVWSQIDTYRVLRIPQAATTIGPISRINSSHPDRVSSPGPGRSWSASRFRFFPRLARFRWISERLASGGAALVRWLRLGFCVDGLIDPGPLIGRAGRDPHHLALACMACMACSTRRHRYPSTSGKVLLPRQRAGTAMSGQASCRAFFRAWDWTGLDWRADRGQTSASHACLCLSLCLSLVRLCPSLVPRAAPPDVPRAGRELVAD